VLEPERGGRELSRGTNLRNDPGNLRACFRARLRARVGASPGGSIRRRLGG